MSTDALAEGLIAIVRQQAARPGGRERITNALRAALAAVEDPTSAACPSVGDHARAGVILDQLANAARHTAATLASIEAAEFFAERGLT